MAAVALGATADAPTDLLFDRSVRTRLRLGLDRAMGWLLPFLFLVAVLPIIDMVYFVSVRALPHLTWEVVTTTNPYQVDALRVPIISTFYVLGLATLFAVLLGLFGGIATAEMLSERAAGWVRTSANLLAGTPSVAFGYFGYFTFVTFFGWGLSFIAGVLTLAFFMTPYIFRAADLAFTSVPRHIREAAFGSGAGPLQYVGRVAAPIAFPQILTGIFLAMAIGVGETAPLWLTTTPGVLLPQTWTSPVVVLTELIWENFSAPTNSNLQILAWQAAFLLLVIVIGLNIVVRLFASHYQKRLEGLYQ
jgi:phosphate transport system permease protein